MSDLHDDAARMGELPRAPRATGYAALTAEGIKLWWIANGAGAGIRWEGKPPEARVTEATDHA